MTLKEILTVTAHVHNAPQQRYLSGYSASITALFFLGEELDYTLLEVTKRLNQAGWQVGDSTVSPRLHELKALGILRDSGPKRPCRIRLTRKKVWRLTEDARDLVTIFQRDDHRPAEGAR
jgi:hypothetical protein